MPNLKEFTLRTRSLANDEFWQNLVNCQINHPALTQSTSLAGTAFRIAQRHPISIDEEVRIQRYAQKAKQKPQAFCARLT